MEEKPMENIDWGLTWTTVQAVSAAVATVVVILTALYVRHQLNEARRARYAQVLDKISIILSDPKVVTARKVVMKLPDNFDIDLLTEDQKAHIELVTRSFDNAGFYLWCKLIPEEYVLPEYPGATWHWRKLRHYVEKQRETEGYEARIFFELMATQTEKFRKKRNLPV